MSNTLNPTQTPPGMMQATAKALPAAPSDAVTASLVSNKHFTGTWSANQPRSAWVYVDGGIGWKQLADSSDAVLAALNMLAAHAVAGGRVVNYVDGADGKIHEIYVF